MSNNPYYKPGDWNAVCSMCGHTRKASELVKNWQGQWRCPKHNEARQPQDFVRGKAESITPPYIQDAIIDEAGVCTPNGRTARPDCATPDCVTPDFISPLFDPTPLV